MANMCMKRCSSSFIIRELYIKTRGSTSIRMIAIIQLIISILGENAQLQKLSFIIDVNESNIATF